MKPLRKRLEKHSRLTGLKLDTIQQDYLLTWMLEGISNHDLLGKHLIFKGGTALKKCYFGTYRFSEDLDFTANKLAPSGKVLENALQAICRDVQIKIDEYAPLSLTINRYHEKSPHPEEQEAFVIKAQFPWQNQPLTRIMIEITRKETLVLPPNECPILHEYEEPIKANILTYSLEEILLEKLRAILQHTKKLHERDWTRSRARDYYDLWQILHNKTVKLNKNTFMPLLKSKCFYKNVDFKTVEDFFSPIMINDVTHTWNRWLGPLIVTLPKLESILQELRESLKQRFF